MKRELEWMDRESVLPLEVLQLIWKELTMPDLFSFISTSSLYYKLVPEAIEDLSLISKRSPSFERRWNVFRYPPPEVFTRFINLTTLTENIYYDEILMCMTNLTNLGLSRDSNISATSIRKLTKLTTLDMSYSQLINTDYLLEMIPTLTKLNLSHCSSPLIREDSISKLTNLTHLDITDVCTLSDKICHTLTSLKSLRISSSGSLTDTGVAMLTNLTHLEIKRDFLSAIPWITGSCIEKLSMLRELTCRESMQGEWLKNLTNLTSLHMPFVSYGNIKDEHLKHLTNITELTIYNSMEITSDSISGMNLKRLVFVVRRGGNITPNDISKFTNLESLCIYNADEFYEIIESLPNLTSLNNGPMNKSFT